MICESIPMTVPRTLWDVEGSACNKERTTATLAFAAASHNLPLGRNKPSKEGVHLLRIYLPVPDLIF